MRLDPITDFQHSDWPGHFFEAEVTKRNPCPIRAVHLDTGFAQGWAHYWEEFFLNMGYPYLRGPRTRELTLISIAPCRSSANGFQPFHG